MLGKTHKYIGTCCGIIATEQLIVSNINEINTNNLMLSGMLIAGSIFGSLALDIDKSGTKAGNKFPTLAKIMNILFGHRGATHAPIIWVILSGILIYISTLLKENHFIFLVMLMSTLIFYSLGKQIVKIFSKNKILENTLGFLFGLACSYFIYTKGINVIRLGYFYTIIGILVGALSHILLDYFNPTGVPLFYPISKKKFRLFGVSEKTGPVFSVIFTILAILSTLNVYLGVI